MARPTIPIRTTPFFNGNNRRIPGVTIDDRASRNTRITTHGFPTDMPLYYTLIIENTWTFGDVTATLTPFAGYRLPLPTHVIDGHEVQYDHGFNWLSALPGALASSPVGSLSAALGYTVNNFKFVTLQSPQYRSYAYEWKMAPKDYNESRNIREIYLGIKKGMHPTLTGARLSLRFPHIFWLGFYPNAGFLTKFKPAVVTSCQLDYQGGNPQPAFYKRADPGDSPPESVVMRLTFLELEYWIEADLEHGKATSNDPFNSSNWYSLGN